MICFTQCDTNPNKAGNLETLTQRYWEAMLSGCLIIGRAPQELIDLIGYNPVIDVDWDTPEEQLSLILKNIDTYQELVDKNVIVAKKYGSWDCRMPLLKKYLIQVGYQI